ncbi:hypothetical protein HQO38_13265 [Rhodococcus fascians]|jgi:hypothetical protein|uniref:hypothetical protein n=1 Tax=Nocardiaceae TaxID=85025 RepID=UPI00041CD1C4|nr:MULTISPECIES: hypothetical protein [Rhodococcus]MDP9638165.1 hypothetical protein [Rhodococcus cercidiphylli]MSX05624.1 hypothetical protein [Actinomycetota bacterium]OZD38502.1 hypothetical protein CH252_32595 [Rhodococcus sp. 06-1477-1B]KMJ51630.1 hypothetical protein ACG96_04180 [Rhodococcus fascians]KQU37006.1 hypothetical protein ASH04_01375 [Rhodococcus sp. Leaf233]
MQGLAVVLFPVLLMLFALAMERVEFRLSKLGVREHEVEEFLDQASKSEVATLANEGFPHALARFNTRKRHQTPPRTIDTRDGMVDQRAS